MMRYLRDEDIADAVCSVKVHKGWMVDLTEVASAISAIPAADVVEAVRCRDCVYWRGENDYCKGIGIDFSENGYCSFGERKDGGQDE